MSAKILPFPISAKAASPQPDPSMIGFLSDLLARAQAAEVRTADDVFKAVAVWHFQRSMKEAPQ